MTVEQVKALLTKDNVWTVKTLRSPTWTRCPRSDLIVATVDPLSDRKVPGKARLSFVNNRLYAVWFIPQDLKSYVRALRQDGLQFDVAGQRSTSGDVRVWLWSESQADAYVGWEDKRLRTEIEDWKEACL